MKEDNELENEIEQKTEDKTKVKIDKGMWIALIAIFISVATAFISLYEAKLMKTQQSIMLEQKSAAAWPYIQIKTNTTVDSNVINLKLVIENKGVGPAILKDVEHYFQGSQVETYNLHNTLNKIYPHFRSTLIQNQQIDNIVLSAKEKIIFLEFNIEIEEDKNENINELISSLNKEINFCYCDIYKECWRYEHHKKGEFENCE